MTDSQHTPWFAKKSFGWGWSIPLAWQGWVTLAAYISLVLSLQIFTGPRENFWLWFGMFCGLTGMLIGICWWKGEKPEWRWGKD